MNGKVLLDTIRDTLMRDISWEDLRSTLSPQQAILLSNALEERARNLCAWIAIEIEAAERDLRRLSTAPPSAERVEVDAK